MVAENKWKESSYATIYTHLFEMLSTESLTDTLEWIYDVSRGKDDYFKKDGKENWFFVFHKSIRQADFFEGIWIERKKELRNEDEVREWKFLRDQVWDKKLKKRSEEEGKLFTDEYSRYLDLNRLMQYERKDYGVTGRIDSILWNTIHTDDNFLHDILELTFAKWDVLRKKVKKSKKEAKA